MLNEHFIFVFTEEEVYKISLDQECVKIKTKKRTVISAKIIALKKIMKLQIVQTPEPGAQHNRALLRENTSLIPCFSHPQSIQKCFSHALRYSLNWSRY